MSSVVGVSGLPHRLFLSSFCALCLVLLVSLDCLIGGFVVVLCLVSSVAGVSGLPHRGVCRRSVLVSSVAGVSGLPHRVYFVVVLCLVLLVSLDIASSVFLSLFCALCLVLLVSLDCLIGFILSLFCALCGWCLWIASSGFLLSSFCALCLVWLVSLDCLIGVFVVIVLCLVSSVAGVSGLPHLDYFVIVLCLVSSVAGVSRLPHRGFCCHRSVPCV